MTPVYHKGAWYLGETDEFGDVVKVHSVFGRHYTYEQAEAAAAAIRSAKKWMSRKPTADGGHKKPKF